jgi:hypothetical protein
MAMAVLKELAGLFSSAIVILPMNDAMTQAKRLHDEAVECLKDSMNCAKERGGIEIERKSK